MNKKTIAIISFAIGGFVGVNVFLGYIFYKSINNINNNTKAIEQIVQYINNKETNK